MSDARVTATVERIDRKVTQDKVDEQTGRVIRKGGKPYRRVKASGVWYSMWDTTELAEGDTVTFREKASGNFLEMTAVNVVPPGATPLERRPNPAALSGEQLADYRAALSEMGMTREEVDLQIDRLLESPAGKLLNYDAALVAVAAQHGITIDRREVVTPATPAHPRPETGSITETRFEAPPKPAGPLCSSPWSDKCNDVRYSRAVIPNAVGASAADLVVGEDEVEEIWHLWSHPRLIFIKRAGTWTTQPAKGHAGVVYQEGG